MLCLTMRNPKDMVRRNYDKLDAVRNVSKDIGNDNNGKAFKVS